MTTTEALRILDLTAPISRESLSNAHQEALIVWCVGRFEGNDELIAKANEKTAQIYAAHAWLKSIPETEYPYQGQASAGAQPNAQAQALPPIMMQPRASSPPPPMAQQPRAMTAPPPPPLQPYEAGASAQVPESFGTTVRRAKKKTPPLTLAAWAVAAVGGVGLALLFSSLNSSKKSAGTDVADSSAAPASATPTASTSAPAPAPAAAGMLTEKSTLEEIRTQAEAGNAVAQRLLGLRYFAGKDVPKNPAEGVKWCRLAAEQGDGDAQHELARAYHQGDGVAKDAVAALVWTRKSAAQGNSGAQFDLAEIYLQGVGVPQDFALGVEWMRKAADQGLREAEYEMGICYYSGEGVTKDLAEAAKWYRKAAEKGEATAQLCLARQLLAGEGVGKDVEEAVNWLLKATDKNHAGAQYEMGLLRATGIGMPKDLSAAVLWFKKAAKQGHAEAQEELGFAYALGDGVEEDEEESFLWYRKAAEQGLAESQYQTGKAYIDGVGVDLNTVEAVKWFRQAAAQGHARAQFHLGFSYAQGEGVKTDAAEAVKWYRLAADQGLADAQYFLGRAYFRGDGVEKNSVQGRDWMTKAAEQGDPQAQNDMGDYHFFQHEPLQAIRWYRRAAENGNSSGLYNLGLSLAKGEGVAEDKAEAYAWWNFACILGQEDAQKSIKDLAQTMTGSEINDAERKGPQLERQHPKLAAALAAAREANANATLPPVATASAPPPAPAPPASMPPPKPAEVQEHLPTDKRLTSGAVIVDKLKNLKGFGKLIVENNLTADVCVKMIFNKQLACSFYVRAGEKFTFDHVPDGVYEILYCSGFNWDLSRLDFSRAREASRFDNTLTYKLENRTENGKTQTYSDIMTITLQRAALGSGSGNAPSTEIPLDEFDRY